jgi:undecaprenyl phosphate-alpha-L-ara4FN deformylase
VTLIALKVDVDTYRGTREGAMRLAELLESLGVRASFLFSLGPDHTGRAIRRAFRRGFIGKVKRTSVLEHYGLKTLLYGVLLPGPHIGRGCRDAMQEIARRGFEVGVHTWDHVRWQDGVARASEAWTRRELTLARDEFLEIFGRAPLVHGAAGWQMNRFLPALQQELGFRYASDTRGTGPFLPLLDDGNATVPQLPTTLPTLDELIGRPDLEGTDPVDHLLAASDAAGTGEHVFTLHAELEGGKYLPAFERLLRGWQQRGAQLTDLATYLATLDVRNLPRCGIVAGTVAGRSGTLAMQSAPQRPAMAAQRA